MLSKMIHKYTTTGWTSSKTIQCYQNEQAFGREAIVLNDNLELVMPEQEDLDQVSIDQPHSSKF